MNSEPPSDDIGSDQDPNDDWQAGWLPPTGAQAHQPSPDVPNPPHPGTQDGGSSKSSTLSLSLRLPHRSSLDRYVAGVSGGLGRRFGFDPFFIRMVLLAATMWFSYNRIRGYEYYDGYGRVTGGTVLVLGLYTLAWLVMPTDRDRSLVARLNTREGAQEAAAAVLCFVLSIVIINNTDHIAPLLIAGLALLLLSGPRERWFAKPKSVSGGDGRPESVMPESVMPESVVPRAVRQRSVRQRSVRQRSVMQRRSPALWPLAIGLLVIAAVIFVAADSTMTDGVRPGIAVNVALLIIGAVLLLSRWKGRAGLTGLLALPLIPLWLGLSATSTPRFDGQGSVTFVPESTDEELSFEHGYGSATLDLRQLELEPGSVTHVSLDMTAGSGLLRLPTEPDIELRIDPGLADVNSWTDEYYRNGLVLGDSVEHFFSQADWDAAHMRYGCSYEQTSAEDLVWMASLMYGDYVFEDPIGTIVDLQAEGFDISEVSGDSYTPRRFVVLREAERFCDPDEEADIFGTDPEPDPIEPATLVVDVSIGFGSMEIIHG